MCVYTSHDWLGLESTKRKIPAAVAYCSAKEKREGGEEEEQVSRCQAAGRFCSFFVIMDWHETIAINIYIYIYIYIDICIH